MIPLLQNKLPKWTLTELCFSELKEFVAEQKKKGVNTITQELRIYLLSLFYSDKEKWKDYSPLVSSCEIGIRKKWLKLEFERMKESMKKNNYQSLVDYVVDEAKKSDFYLTEVLMEFLKRFDLSEEQLNKLFKQALEVAKTNPLWAEYVILRLLKTRKISKENLVDAFEQALEVAKTNPLWAKYILPELLITWKINKEILTEAFEQAIEIAKSNLLWIEYVIPVFINLAQLDKNLVKEKVNLLFVEIIKEIKQDLYKLKHIVPLARTNRINNDLLKKELKWIISQINSSGLVADSNVKIYLSKIIHALPLEDYIEILEEKWLFEVLWKEDYTRLVGLLEREKRYEFVKKHSDIDFDKEILKLADKADNIENISPNWWILYFIALKKYL